jgi:uncharacterized protein (DUF486 family)
MHLIESVWASYSWTTRNKFLLIPLFLALLKVMQEVITLLVFVPFSIYFMQQRLKLDYLWAGLCLVSAVYFVFRA